VVWFVREIASSLNGKATNSASKQVTVLGSEGLI
jgi:hypothetical protein